MRGLGARRAAGFGRLGLRRGGFQPRRALRLFDRFRLRRRRRFGERNLDQLLNTIDRMLEVDLQSRQQRKTDERLNRDDRGERLNALPRPCQVIALSVSGNGARSGLAVVAAPILRQRAIDRAAGNDTANGTRRGTEETTAKHLAPDHCAGNATGHLAGRGRRVTAVLPGITGLALVGVVMRIIGRMRLRGRQRGHGAGAEYRRGNEDLGQFRHRHSLFCSVSFH